MKYREVLGHVTVKFLDIDVDLHGVIYYPASPATEIDPPEPSFAEWDRVTIGGVEVRELFHGELGEQLETALIDQIEGAIA